MTLADVLGTGGTGARPERKEPMGGVSHRQSLWAVSRVVGWIHSRLTLRI